MALEFDGFEGNYIRRIAIVVNAVFIGMKMTKLQISTLKLFELLDKKEKENLMDLSNDRLQQEHTEKASRINLLAFSLNRGGL